MYASSSFSSLAGTVHIPASKSHTIRAVLLSAFANGTSVINCPLVSDDTLAALDAARAFGAEVAEEPDRWLITNTDILAEPPKERQIDVKNSGTTLYMSMALASTLAGSTYFDGDDQIRRRSAKNLLIALEDLGATTHSNAGCCPLMIEGVMRGGRTVIECPTSQYLSALLMAAPMCSKDTEIEVPMLMERPYVLMTLDWLARLDVNIDCSDDFSLFTIRGNQRWSEFTCDISGDYSSATFFIVAAGVTRSVITITGLERDDIQGDKAILDYMSQMGMKIEWSDDGLIVDGTNGLCGVELDLNATPDALPILAVAGAFAEGRTRLYNVEQARIKETDRIYVMAAELRKLGVKIEELQDGLIIEGGNVTGGEVCGHGDHRVVMSLLVAGLGAKDAVQVDTAESMNVTVPEFVPLISGLGGSIEIRKI